MSKLSWGEPKVEIAPTTDGSAPSTGWKALPEIKQDTATLSTEAGETTEALDEGGDVVDTRTKKSKYTFECDVYVQKGMKLEDYGIEDEDGVVTTNFSVRLTPEDATCHGWILDNTSLSVQESWSSTDGSLWHLTFKGLKPKEGKTLKPYSEE